MRPFTDVLRDIRKGRVVDAATEQLAEVVQAVMATEKAGKLVLELTVKPQGKGDNAVIVSAKLTSKAPQPNLPDALFFADLDGDLLRDDPTQQRLFADSSDKVDPKTGEVLSA